VVRSYIDDRPYGWFEKEKEWKSQDNATVFWVTFGRSGRQYRTNYVNNKVFQQVPTPMQKACSKNPLAFHLKKQLFTAKKQHLKSNQILNARIAELIKIVEKKDLEPIE